MKNLFRSIGALLERQGTEPTKCGASNNEHPTAYQNPCYHLQVGTEYGQILPHATYSPWNMDSDFCAVSEIIKDHTLVDNFRCYELWTLVEQSAKLTGDIIEIGTWRGGTGALMAVQAARCGIDGKVYLCDTFTGVVKSSDKDTYYNDGEHADVSLEGVRNLIDRQLGLNNVEILQGMFPEDTGHQVAQNRFRLCHIDVDVYQSASDILDWVWERLVPGGIVVYDDYGFQSCDGIRKHVNEIKSRKDGIVLHNLNGHAIVMKYVTTG
jgi:O-methyltransferase